MDNLTHTLIGVTTAHALPRRFRKPSIYWALVVGNNLPDADFIQSRFPGATALNYLVHHRGYTHSFLLAPLLAIVGAWIAAWLSGHRGRLSREIYLFALLGCFMHVSADFLNNYGVHPFSPVWNRWFYGDTLFIIEPLLWMILLPLAIALARRRSAQVFWSVLIAAGGALLWATDMVAFPFKVIATAVGVFSLLVHFRTRSAVPGTIAALVVLSLFSVSGGLARREVRARLADEGIPTARILDVDSTPAPGNPLCWGSWVSLDDPETLLHRWGYVALVPRWMAASDCAAANPRELTAERGDPLGSTSDSRLLWVHEVRTPRADVKYLREHSCEFQRAMTFYRYPYVRRVTQDEWYATDLRYDRKERAFTAFTWKASATPVDCPRGSAPWEEPSGRNAPRQ